MENRNILRKLSTEKVLGWTTLILILIVTLLPFVWAIRTALTPNSQIFNGDYSLIPTDASWINFKRVLGFATTEEDLAAGGSGAKIYFWLYLRNSLIFTAILVLGQVVTSTMAAYAFARLHFPGRDKIFAILLTGMMIPPDFYRATELCINKKSGTSKHFHRPLGTLCSSFTFRHFLFATILSIDSSRGRRSCPSGWGEPMDDI